MIVCVDTHPWLTENTLPGVRFGKELILYAPGTGADFDDNDVTC